MSSIESLLHLVALDSPREELQAVAQEIGACITRRDDRALERFQKRLRALKREAPPGSWHAGFADSLVTALDGYFGSIEITRRLDQLESEVSEVPLWREILLALRGHELNQEAIRRTITERDDALASSKATISIALEDLRVRELVEHVPGEDRRERVHSLTRRGRLLCERVASGAATLPTAATPATSGSSDARPRALGAIDTGPVVATARASRRERRESGPG